VARRGARGVQEAFGRVGGAEGKEHVKMRNGQVGFLLVLMLAAASSGGAADVDLIDARTPWRAQLVVGMNMLREGAVLKITERHRNYLFDPAAYDPQAHKFWPMPPAGWTGADFDDDCWARYLQDDLADYLGGYGEGTGGEIAPALLCLRTRFGISDPQRAAGLKLTVTCLGGGVVFVNGRQVGRGFMPSGPLHPLTPASDYPIEAYTTEGNASPLPALRSGTGPEPRLLDRYKKRIRTFTVTIPPDALVKGANVLAVELRRAAVAGPTGRGGAWGHLGFHEIKLTAPDGGGAIPYAEALKGTRLWSARANEQITNAPSERSLVRKNWFWTLLWSRGMPVKGVQVGNPFDPLRPVKMIVPRNGVCSGQAVVSDLAGLRGVSATVAPFQGPGGAVMPAAAAQVRFAAQHEGLHYCDALMVRPPDGARTVPVWVVLKAPKGQPAGWYCSTLSIRANGKSFSVPLRVLVTGLTLPDAKDFASTIGISHSPDTLAMQYNVEPWSPKHLALMDKSLELMGQVGNDVIYVPVILGPLGGTGKTAVDFNVAPIIRWTKTAGGLQPDFTILEKYLDAYGRHCAAPRGISLYIWGIRCAREMVQAYEGGGLRKGTEASETNSGFAPPRVHVWDPKANTVTEQEVPVIGAAGSEKFWKPLVDGVRALVVKRGWSERCVMLGLGGDSRPGRKTVDLFKEWAPYARWNYLSHFSGDPGPKDGKLIATGGGEIGLKEWPWLICTRFSTAAQFEERLAAPLDFIEMPTARWMHQEYSPPLLFRTLAMMWGEVGRIGLDFWMARERGKPRATSFIGSHINSLTVPGPDGAVPTVRFEMFREGVQDVEVRGGIIRAYLKLPAEQRKGYRELIDELPSRVGQCGGPLPCQELNLDWAGYVARVHLAAAQLAGAKTDARWDQPPK